MNFKHNICHVTELKQNLFFKHRFTEVIFHILNFIYLSYFNAVNISATFRSKPCQVLLDPRYRQGIKHSAAAPDPTRLQMCANVVYLSIPFSPAAAEIEAARPRMVNLNSSARGEDE